MSAPTTSGVSRALPESIPTIPELDQYQDQPKQAPAGKVGKTGVLEMRFVDRGDKTILRDMYRKTPMLVQQALYWDEALPTMPCVYMISTSGSVLQGDRLFLTIEMEPGSLAHVTTQSATKVHRMDANHASQLQKVVLAENSYLELMPGVTIPHRNTRYYARTEVTIDPSATLLFSEIVMPGRKYHNSAESEGELFVYDLFSTLITASRPDGKSLFTEKLVIQPKRFPVRHNGIMGRYDVFGNVILLTPKEHADEILEQVVAGPDGKVISGASRLPNDAGLIFKVLGPESEPVKAKVREFWAQVRKSVRGTTIPPVPLWG
ncbi:urease accessory protein UreD [Rhodococcus sp. ARC_M6]|uniref:urease accessory protein UreD n=1 Tax=Rhodococcus sp. ARC_M6 TaxID=2928852 RepID=UPI001FB497CA|nr:urease accessory protein UreD [Rhodococcus sp. ARC_M6]MCJ0904417.1 urease accessory protein UreD [Rhodococcus sp. ARC_M6]